MGAKNNTFTMFRSIRINEPEIYLFSSIKMRRTVPGHTIWTLVPLLPMSSTNDLIIRNHGDIADKMSDANPDLLPRLFTMSTFSDRIPRGIDCYLVLLWFYGLFTKAWALPEEHFDWPTAGRDYSPSPEDFTEQMAAIKESPILREWNNIANVLLSSTFYHLTSCNQTSAITSQQQ
jgi:hypothetical protein